MPGPRAGGRLECAIVRPSVCGRRPLATRPSLRAMEFLPFTRPSIDDATIAAVADVLRSLESLA